jgi:hypothetical protein
MIIIPDGTPAAIAAAMFNLEHARTIMNAEGKLNPPEARLPITAIGCDPAGVQLIPMGQGGTIVVIGRDQAYRDQLIVELTTEMLAMDAAYQMPLDYDAITIFSDESTTFSRVLAPMNGTARRHISTGDAGPVPAYYRWRVRELPHTNYIACDGTAQHKKNSSIYAEHFTIVVDRAQALVDRAPRTVDRLLVSDYVVHGRIVNTLPLPVHITTIASLVQANMPGMQPLPTMYGDTYIGQVILWEELQNIRPIEVPHCNVQQDLWKHIVRAATGLAIDFKHDRVTFNVPKPPELPVDDAAVPAPGVAVEEKKDEPYDFDTGTADRCACCYSHLIDDFYAIEAKPSCMHLCLCVSCAWHISEHASGLTLLRVTSGKTLANMLDELELSHAERDMYLALERHIRGNRNTMLSKHITDAGYMRIAWRPSMPELLALYAKHPNARFVASI